MIALRLTKTIKALLIVNLAVFILQQILRRGLGINLIDFFGLTPAAFVLDFHFWQIFTYAFLHADVFHVFFNLLILAFIGGELESIWGRVKFLKFYIFCAAGAGLLYVILQFLFGGIFTPLVGASGAIYGILIAFSIFFGERTLLFMMIFPMRAKHFIWVLIGIEFLSSLASTAGAWSAVAHFGGMGAGLAYLWVPAYLRARRKAREYGGGLTRSERSLKRKRRKKDSHLRLVSNKDDNFDQDNDPKSWH
jgi:membrane associated rhomboid family serine protease